MGRRLSVGDSILASSDWDSEHVLHIEWLFGIRERYDAGCGQPRRRFCVELRPFEQPFNM